MVMKLYGADIPNVQRAILPLFEAEHRLGLMAKNSTAPQHFAENMGQLSYVIDKVDVEKELELVKVDIIFSRDQKKPIFLSKQPFGQIPYLEDGDISIFESRAIARYITEKYGTTQTLLGKTPQHRAAVNQWVESEVHNIYPVAQTLVREILSARGFQRPVNQELVTAAMTKLRKLLEVYEAHLAAKGDGNFLVGEEYSLADACHAPYLKMVADLTPQVVRGLPRVTAWVDAVTSRPAFRKCMELDWDSAPRLE